MPKFAAGLLIASLMTMLTASTVERGVRDATQSLTHWSYFPIRDMRQTVVIDPQKTMTRTPPDESVPTVGREQTQTLQVLAASLTNPIAPTSESILQGEAAYRRICTPCHGAELKGDGPVIQFYIPPPDLQGAGTRGRPDGYIYGYIRNGGAVMPTYGFQLSAEETWHIVNFIRHRQQTEPR